MAVDDHRQNLMPLEADRNLTDGSAAPLEYKEAVRMVKPKINYLKGRYIKIDPQNLYSLIHIKSSFDSTINTKLYINLEIFLNANYI